MKQKFEALAKIFQIDGEISSIEVISNGNINQTYDVTVNDKGNEKRYVFQRLNIFVFKNPKRIMQNIEKITTHISAKLEAVGKSRENARLGQARHRRHKAVKQGQGLEVYVADVLPVRRHKAA